MDYEDEDWAVESEESSFSLGGFDSWISLFFVVVFLFLFVTEVYPWFAKTKIGVIFFNFIYWIFHKIQTLFL